MSQNNNQTGNIPFLNRSRGARIRKVIADIALGLFVIAIGVGYLGNYISILPWADFTLFFPGWGALFLIVPSVYWLIRRPFSWWWPICLLIGVLVLLANQESYTFGTAAAIVLAAFVILVGLRIILAPLFKRWRRRRWRQRWSSAVNRDPGDVIFTDASGGANADGKYHVAFGDRHITIDDEFTSATLSVSFGDMTFDLTGAQINGCAVIDATCSFGDIFIRVPPTARVELSPTSVFADVRNHHAAPADPQAPVVYINASCSFGDISIH